MNRKLSLAAFADLSGGHWHCAHQPPPIRAFLRSATAFRTLETCSRGNWRRGSAPAFMSMATSATATTWVEDLSQMLGLGPMKPFLTF